MGTQNRSKKKTYGFIMACIELCVIGQNSLSHWKARIWLRILAFKKNSRHTHRNGWGRPQFQKGQPTPCKTTYVFPWVREFWPQIYSLSQALDWGLLCKIL